MSSAFESSRISLNGNRQNNQDRCAIISSANCALLVVADGMGGHPKGDQAAQLVIDTCEDAFMRIKKPIPDPGLFLDYLGKQAHEQIVAFGEQHLPVIDPRTTMVVALVQEGVAWWGHVGDSRLYRFRRGRVINRTIDHSYVERLHQDGLIGAEQKANHPYRNYVTRCLGGFINAPEVTLAEGSVILERGDILLLCSDGLWGTLGDERLAAAFDSDEPVWELLRRIAKLAEQEAAPTSDNVSGVALRWRLPAVRPRAPANTDKVSLAVDELKTALEHFEAKTND